MPGRVRLAPGQQNMPIESTCVAGGYDVSLRHDCPSGPLGCAGSVGSARLSDDPPDELLLPLDSHPEIPATPSPRTSEAKTEAGNPRGRAAAVAGAPGAPDGIVP